MRGLNKTSFHLYLMIYVHRPGLLLNKLEKMHEMITNKLINSKNMTQKLKLLAEQVFGSFF